MVAKTEEDQKICIYLTLKTYTEIKPVIYLFIYGLFSDAASSADE
jgi:hypothetical protein